jgi:hypothetical protein
VEPLKPIEDNSEGPQAMEIFVRDIHLNLIGSSLSKGPPLLAVKVEEVVIYNTYELMFS